MRQVKILINIYNCNPVSFSWYCSKILETLNVPSCSVQSIVLEVQTIYLQIYPLYAILSRKRQTGQCNSDVGETQKRGNFAIEAYLALERLVSRTRLTPKNSYSPVSLQRAFFRGSRRAGNETRACPLPAASVALNVEGTPRERKLNLGKRG